jgi:chorismate mutase
MDLNQIRKEINELDDRIAGLLNERMELVERVIEYKKQTGMSVADSTREAEILTRVCEGKYAEELREIFTVMFEVSKKYQKKKLGS